MKDELHQTQREKTALERENAALRAEQVSLTTKIDVLWTQIEENRHKRVENTLEMKLAEAKTVLAQTFASKEALEDEISALKSLLMDKNQSLTVISSENAKLRKQNTALMDKAEGKLQVRHVTPVKEGGKDGKPPVVGMEKGLIKPFQGISMFGKEDRSKKRTNGSLDLSSSHQGQGGKDNSFRMEGKGANVKCE